MDRVAPRLGVAPSWWVPILLALALFVATDFVRFIVHYCEHKIGPLWEIHKVHHSAEVLNFATVDRQHPIQRIYYGFGVALATALVNGVFVWAFAERVTQWSLLGGNGFVVAASMLCSTLRHSPCWLSFGPRIEKWLISPAQHQIHHSTNPIHFGKNLGGILAICDRMLGTLHVTGPAREVTAFGLGEENARYRSIPALYLVPLWEIGRALTPASLRPSRPRASRTRS